MVIEALKGFNGQQAATEEAIHLALFHSQFVTSIFIYGEFDRKLFQW